jgi:hypothetical protein
MVPVLAEIDKLPAIFSELEKLGLPANYVVRLHSTQDILRRSVLRIYHIQKMQFVPSIHILVQTSRALVVLYPSLSFANNEFTFANNLRLNTRSENKGQPLFDHLSR